MDVGEFERVIDHAFNVGVIDADSIIHLFDRGEPTLHPQFCSIVEALNKRGLDFGISSNCGNAVFIPEELSMARLAKFVISMPGFSQASYDRIHSLPFEKVLQNIETTLSNFRERGFRGEAVMSLHTYRFNLQELALAAEYCEQHDIIFSPYYAFFADYKCR